MTMSDEELNALIGTPLPTQQTKKNPEDESLALDYIRNVVRSTIAGALYQMTLPDLNVIFQLLKTNVIPSSSQQLVVYTSLLFARRQLTPKLGEEKTDEFLLAIVLEAVTNCIRDIAPKQKGGK